MRNKLVHVLKQIVVAIGCVALVVIVLGVKLVIQYKYGDLAAIGFLTFGTICSLLLIIFLK